MKKIIFFKALLFTVFFLVSCKNDDKICTTEAVAGLNITIKDVATGLKLCDGVTVTANDGDYSEALQLFTNPEPVFVGAFEREGNYVITVTKEGYQPFTSDTMFVISDICHVVTQLGEFEIAPINTKKINY